MGQYLAWIIPRKESSCSYEIPGFMYGPAPTGLNFYMVIYGEIKFKMFFSSNAVTNGTSLGPGYPNVFKCS